MDKKQAKEKTFSVELTKEQTAIIKAGLQYYWLADDYGYALWGTVPDACFSGSDRRFRNMVTIIYDKLSKLSKVKPEYGYWGDIKRIAKLCDEDYQKNKKWGEEAEQKMHEEYLRDEAISEVINKHGLNGNGLLQDVHQVFKEKMEAAQRKKAQRKLEKNKSEDEEIMAIDL